MIRIPRTSTVMLALVLGTGACTSMNTAVYEPAITEFTQASTAMTGAVSQELAQERQRIRLRALRGTVTELITAPGAAGLPALERNLCDPNEAHTLMAARAASLSGFAGDLSALTKEPKGDLLALFIELAFADYELAVSDDIKDRVEEAARQCRMDLANATTHAYGLDEGGLKVQGFIGAAGALWALIEKVFVPVAKQGLGLAIEARRAQAIEVFFTDPANTDDIARLAGHIRGMSDMLAHNAEETRALKAHAAWTAHGDLAFKFATVQAHLTCLKTKRCTGPVPDTYKDACGPFYASPVKIDRHDADKGITSLAYAKCHDFVMKEFATPFRAFSTASNEYDTAAGLTVTGHMRKIARCDAEDDPQTCFGHFRRIARGELTDEERRLMLRAVVEWIKFAGEIEKLAEDEKTHKALSKALDDVFGAAD